MLMGESAIHSMKVTRWKEVITKVIKIVVERDIEMETTHSGLEGRGGDTGRYQPPS